MPLPKPKKRTYHGEGTFRSPESVIGYIKRHKNIYDRCNIDKEVIRWNLKSINM
jgi:hypothetical protein